MHDDTSQQSSSPPDFDPAWWLHESQTEKHFLSRIVQHPSDSDAYRRPADHFSDARFASIASAVYELHGRGQLPDVDSVWSIVSDPSSIADINVYDYLDIITQWCAAPTRFLRSRLDDFRAERMVRAMSAQMEAAAARGDVKEAKKLAVSAASIDSSASQRDDIERCDEAMRRQFEKFMQPRKAIRWNFGVRGLDDAIGGVVPGSMSVVGGDTGTGKSTFVLGACFAMARAGRRPAYISCEDPPDVVRARLLSMMSGVSANAITRCTLTTDQVSVCGDAAQRHRDMQLYLAYEVGRGVDATLSAIHALVRDHGVDCIVVDYLQAIRVDAGKGRYDKLVSDVARALKGCCAGLGVPLILVSQLTRPQAGSEHREPSMHSLKESGDIENEAEVIIMLWKPSNTDSVSARLAKLKWGPSGAMVDMGRSESGACLEDESYRYQD